VEEILVHIDVKPVLAVVPDNQDETLKVSEANTRFWDEVRAWQARGWTIGLHGYQHLYATHDSGLIGIKKLSEFSGLSYADQQLKLRRALDIFEREGIIADVWVAPGHSFDETTLRVLHDLGVRHVSDGFSLYPYVDSREMMWIPQQLWRFRRMPLGVWTICLHVNHWTQEDVVRFRSELREFAPVLTEWRSIVASYQNRKPNPFDALFSGAYQTVVKGRRWLREVKSAL